MNKNFCILPWVHLSVYQDGKVKPCCRSGNDAIMGDLTNTNETLDSIANSKKMGELRQAMINNEASEICRRCYKEEELGKESFRMTENKRLERFHYLAEESPVIHLRDIGMRFSNVCNFSCRTCGPNSSTSWYFDAKILSGKKTGYKKALKPLSTFEELLEQITPFKDTLEEFYFAGGEPMMAIWHDKLLDWFIENDFTNLYLSYSTNFSFVHKNNFAILEKWKKFRKVELLVSIDGLEKKGEYIRKGLVWDTFKTELNQFVKLTSELPNVFFSISCTVSIFNVFHFIDVIKYFLTNYKLAGYLIRIDGVTEPAIYNINLLPEEYKALAIQKIMDFKIEIEASSIVAKETIVRQLESIMSQLNTPAESVDFQSFLKATAHLDQLRGEDFRSTFSEFSKV